MGCFLDYRHEKFEHSISQAAVKDLRIQLVCVYIYVCMHACMHVRMYHFKLV